VLSQDVAELTREIAGSNPSANSMNSHVVSQKRKLICVASDMRAQILAASLQGI
jgi:hypothetical protein